MSKRKRNFPNKFNPDWNGVDDLDFYVSVKLIPTLDDYDYVYKAIAFKEKRDEPEDYVVRTRRHTRKVRHISYDDRIMFKRNERTKRLLRKGGGSAC